MAHFIHGLVYLLNQYVREELILTMGEGFEPRFSQ